MGPSNVTLLNLYFQNFGNGKKSRILTKKSSNVLQLKINWRLQSKNDNEYYFKLKMTLIYIYF